MPSIEQPNNDFPCIKPMEDDFEVPSSSCDDMGSAKGNQHISQIFPTHSLLILKDHARTVNLTFFCAKSYLLNVLVHSTPAKSDPATTFVIKPFQQIRTEIVVRPIVERTTTGFFQILFGHQ